MGPLTAVRVIEVGGIGPIPFCGMMLGDMGADVIRIDRLIVSGSKADSPFTDILRRNRRVLAVDLKAPRGLELLLRMIERADVLLEGFRPGVMERIGLGPDVCLARNERLVYGRMTGWGQTGPLAQVAGHDINYISSIGALKTIGTRERPVPPLNLVGDYGGGAMFLTVGVCAALYEREKSGQGQVIDAAMIDGAALLMNTAYQFMQNGEWSAEREANLLDGGAHFYGVYETSDREFIAIAAAESQFYRALLAELGLSGDSELLAGQMDRTKWPAFRERFATVFRTKTRAEWSRQLLDKDVCFAPVLDFDEARAFAQNRARDVFVSVGGYDQAAPAPRFSRTASRVPTEAGRLGQHTESILNEVGLDAGEIEELRAAQVVM